MKQLINFINESLNNLSIDNFNLFIKMCEYIQKDKNLKELIDYFDIKRNNSNTSYIIIQYKVKENKISFNINNKYIDVSLNDFITNLKIRKYQLFYKDDKILFQYKGVTIKNPETIHISFGLNDSIKDQNFLHTKLDDKLDKNKLLTLSTLQYPIMSKLEEDDYYMLFDLILENSK